MKKKEKIKRGRPKGSKNKKVFPICDFLADHIVKRWIAEHGIDNAEQLAVKTLEKIRANKAQLNEKYPT